MVGVPTNDIPDHLDSTRASKVRVMSLAFVSLMVVNSTYPLMTIQQQEKKSCFSQLPRVVPIFDAIEKVRRKELATDWGLLLHSGTKILTCWLLWGVIVQGLSLWSMFLAVEADGDGLACVLAVI